MVPATSRYDVRLVVSQVPLPNDRETAIPVAALCGARVVFWTTYAPGPEGPNSSIVATLAGPGAGTVGFPSCGTCYGVNRMTVGVPGPYAGVASAQGIDMSLAVGMTGANLIHAGFVDPAGNPGIPLTWIAAAPYTGP